MATERANQKGPARHVTDPHSPWLYEPATRFAASTLHFPARCVAIVILKADIRSQRLDVSKSEAHSGEPNFQTAVVQIG
jgi:hypothetical protein